MHQQLLAASASSVLVILALATMPAAPYIPMEVDNAWAGYQPMTGASSSTTPAVMPLVVGPKAAPLLPERPPQQYPEASPDWAAVWQVQGDKPNTWVDYDAEWSRRLEEAFQTGKATFEARPGAAVTFSYDTNTSIQTNLETSGQRYMRRCLVEKFLKKNESGRLTAIEASNKANWTGDRLKARRKKSRSPPAGSGERARSKSMARRS